jgi:hypothetical protein
VTDDDCSVPVSTRVWFRHRDRWYPAILELWDHARGVGQCWLRYVADVEGRTGGWHSAAWLEQGTCPADPGLSWEAAAGEVVHARASQQSPQVPKISRVWLTSR